MTDLSKPFAIVNSLRDDTPEKVCVECGDAYEAVCAQCDANLCSEHRVYIFSADEDFCGDAVACVVRYEAAKS